MMLSQISPEKVKPVVDVPVSMQPSLDHSSLSLPMKINFESTPAATTTVTDIGDVTAAVRGEVLLPPDLMSVGVANDISTASFNTAEAAALQNPTLQQGVDQRTSLVVVGSDKVDQSSEDTIHRAAAHHPLAATILPSSSPIDTTTTINTRSDPPVVVVEGAPTSSNNAAAPAPSSIDPALIEVLSLIQQHIHHLQDQQNSFERFVTEQFTQLQHRIGNLEHQPPPNEADRIDGMRIHPGSKDEEMATGAAFKEPAAKVDSIREIEEEELSKSKRKPLEQAVVKEVTDVEKDQKLKVMVDKDAPKDDTQQFSNDRQYLLMTEMTRRLELLESVIRHGGSSPGLVSSPYNGSMQRKYLSDAHEHRLELMEQLVSQPSTSNNSPVVIDMKRTTARRDYVLDHSNSPGSVKNLGRSPVMMQDQRVDSSPNPLGRTAHLIHRTPSYSSLDAVSLSAETKISYSSPDRGSRPKGDGMMPLNSVSNGDHSGSQTDSRGYNDDRSLRTTNPDDGNERRYNRDDRSFGLGNRLGDMQDSDRRRHSSDRNDGRSDRRYSVDGGMDRRDDYYDVEDRRFSNQRIDDADLHYRRGNGYPVDDANHSFQSSNVSYQPDIDRSYMRTFSDTLPFPRESFQLSNDSLRRPTYHRRDFDDSNNDIDNSQQPNSRRPNYSQSLNSSGDLSLKQPSNNVTSEFFPETGHHSSPNELQSRSSLLANTYGGVPHPVTHRISAPSYMRPTTSQAIRLSQSTDIPRFDDFWLNPNLR